MQAQPGLGFAQFIEEAVVNNQETGLNSYAFYESAGAKL